MTRHLIDLNHRRIAIVTGPAERSSSVERLAGFRDTMASAGLPIDEALVVTGDFTLASGTQAMRTLTALPERPSAVFACNDEMALGCMAALAEQGLLCPDDISVAGFDDSVGARFSRPPLTTIRQPLAEMTSEAVRRLIDGENYHDAVLSEACTLMVNRSTGPRNDPAPAGPRGS